MDTADAFVAELDTAMVVVTTVADDDGERSGCLVGFFTQVSIDPWRVLVCISKANHTYRTAQRASHLAVHRLDMGDVEVSTLFGERTGDQIDKFARCSWRDGPNGVPLIDGLAVVVGRIIDRIDLGDHVGHLIEPVAVFGESMDDRPLRLSDVDDMEPGHPRSSGSDDDST
jgi:flavin reductase (DIM6/NTAB) family NADH-FMN oxidoreductase RutF